MGLGEKEVKEDNPSEGMYVRYYLIQNMFLILTDKNLIIISIMARCQVHQVTHKSLENNHHLALLVFSLVSRYIQECVHTCTQSSLKWRVLYLTEKGKVIITT